MRILNQTAIFNSQSGKIVSWVLLVVTGIWTALYLSLDALITMYLSPVYLTMFHLTLLVVSLFFLGYAIHTAMKNKSKLAGDKDFAKKLKIHNEKMLEIIEENEIILAKILSNVRENSLTLSDGGRKRIRAAEDLIRNLKIRYGKVSENIFNGSNAKLIVADSLIRAKTVSSSYNQLNPEIAYQNGQQALNETKAKLNKIIEEILVEQRKGQ